MKVGDKTLSLTNPVVMAIVNVTPDSFWEGSRKFGEQEIADRIGEAREQGAAILDIGGYSSRPGADEVSPAEELRRVSLGVEVAHRVAPELIISIDTFRADVARGVLQQYGEVIINDISAGEIDPEIIDVVAEYGVPYIAMHMRGTPADMQNQISYDDVADQVFDYLAERAALLRAKGVNDIILDPGFGFAKDAKQNYELLAKLDELTAKGFPVLAGISRKSMIYNTLGVSPAEALAGTTALHWECLRQGAKILRVHDVAAAGDVIKLFNYYTDIKHKTI